MRSTNLAGGMMVLALAVSTAGCGRTPSTGTHSTGISSAGASSAEAKSSSRAESNPDPSSPAEPAAEYDVKPAAATSKIPPLDDKVEPAIAEVPTLPASTKEATVIPVGPGVPMPLDELSDAELVMPKVFMTEAHAKTCRVQVADSFPNFELPDLKGAKQPLAKLLGEKLTVVVFWDGKHRTALVELADLKSLVARRFGNQGVALVGINTGDDPQLAAELAQQAEADFVMLSDRDGAALAEVASEQIPRTYLLDADGKILWFDLEYSRTTRRDLAAAIRFSLAGK